MKVWNVTVEDEGTAVIKRCTRINLSESTVKMQDGELSETHYCGPSMRRRLLMFIIWSNEPRSQWEIKIWTNKRLMLAHFAVVLALSTLSKVSGGSTLPEVRGGSTLSEVPGESTLPEVRDGST